MPSMFCLTHIMARTSWSGRSILYLLGLSAQLLSLVAALPALKEAAAASPQLTCWNEAHNPFDYSAKPRADTALPVCKGGTTPTALFARQVTQNDDFSCSQSRPCSNGACCSKTSGFCGYGPASCGNTNMPGENDLCWSNCDAKAECGKFAKTPGQTCPLNVCCSQFGFCGMTPDFCAVTSDPDKSCQSNCEQPGSGASGGNVQNRVIGYYEAWVADRKCNGMSIDQIPVNGLTHLHFAFGYITPGDFKVVPMDGVNESVLVDFTNVKSRNSGLKTIISLGGWSFNDNGTATQPVFSNIAGNAANRQTFITNLLAFIRQYAFDGVDFDWEYPGAGDRGGQDADGANFVTLLKELRDATNKEPVPYLITFTTPTSYWYLRHFDLTAVNYVDWINVMSYDLHGVWDATNPIGNHVLGHTNITEIKLALDLYWRNNIPPSKLNIGLGFYGRSFQLSDPSCSQPGCNFKGGADPGPCTANSGTLAYFEIMDVIRAKGLTPYYDQDAQVKYVVWNNDQWISYDDKDTFQAKIKFANDLGLGGILIWSVDQDTPALDALNAVLAPQSIDAFKSEADDVSYWTSPGSADCYVTDCGGSCNPGFIKITNQPCGGAKPITRHSTQADSSLCCPLSGAPDPAQCVWRGTASSCNGHCQDDEVAVELNRWGDGKYCESGNKAYCCHATAAENTCYWTGVGGDCNSGDQPLTFAGTFLQTIADIVSVGKLFGSPLEDFLRGVNMDLRKLYCCPPDMMEQWQNCDWHGDPGNCDDNHCDIGHQVQLAQSDYGGGQSCAPRFERTRVFCCDPAQGKSPFPPVELDFLFPNLPSGSNLHTEDDLRIDNTWGTGTAKTSTSDDPNNAAFAFWVMASPDEIQVSLDRRDGSHWALFNCDTHSGEVPDEQTVQMVCTDFSEDSNCYKLSLGHGVPGTILQMPPHCGGSKYVVAKSMEVSQNQSVAHILKKRMPGGMPPVVYDLTFDFDWERVPRDLGNTQLRVDFSNEVGYWDAIVDQAGDRKKKRTLAEAGGNHRRWLEDEWRDDLHYGGLSRDELHKRWFGKDIIDWLKGLLNINIKPTFTHDYSDSLTAIILRDEWNCDHFNAKIEATATASIKMSSSFGISIIINALNTPLDFSQSYLFLQTNGEISAIFSIDALAQATFDSGDIPLLDIPFPGAAFSIKNLFSIGPRLIVNAKATAEFQMAGHFEARADIASWSIRQTYPQAGSDWDPAAVTQAQRDVNIQGLQPPTFDASITANGVITVHLMPTLHFGIDFGDDKWGASAAAELVADGYVRARAEVNIGTSTDACPFQYAVDAGAKLTARAIVPAQFPWTPRDVDLFPFEVNLIPGDGSNWVCPTRKAKREIVTIDGRETVALVLDGAASNVPPAVLPGSGTKLLLSDTADPLNETSTFTQPRTILGSHSLEKRGATYGPFFHIPLQLCPSTSDGSSSDCGAVRAYDDDQLGDPEAVDKRRHVVTASEFGLDDDDLSEDWSDWDEFFNITHGTSLAGRDLEKRAGGTRTFDICEGDAKMTIISWGYPAGTTIYDNDDWTTCNDFGFGVQQNRQNGHKYVDEHILELQMVKIFIDTDASRDAPPAGYDSVCKYLNAKWMGQQGYVAPNSNGYNSGNRVNVWRAIFSAYPNKVEHGDEMVVLENEVNLAKERAFNNIRQINDEAKMAKYIRDNVNKAIKNLKITILAYKYMANPTINGLYATQAHRLGEAFADAEEAMAQNWGPGNYESLDLHTKWEEFILEYTDNTRLKFENYLTKWLDVLEEQYDMAADATQQTIIDKIAHLRTQATLLAGTWVSPF